MFFFIDPKISQVGVKFSFNFFIGGHVVPLQKTDLNKEVGTEQDLEAIVAEKKAGAVVRPPIAHQRRTQKFHLQ